MAPRFTYRPRRPQDIEKRARQTGGDFQGFVIDECKTFQPKKGANCVRILPATWDDAAHYGLEVWSHYGIGPGGKSAVVCLNRMKNQRCPVCEEVARLDRAGDDEDAKRISAKKRVMVWIIDRNDEKAGPQLWVMPWTVDKEIAKQSQDRQSGEYLMIDDPDQGYDIDFDREGEGLTTKYTGVKLARRPTSVNDEFIQYAVELPLPETLIWRNVEEVEELFGGGGDPEPEPAPRRSASRQADEPRRSRYAAPPDDDQGEDEEPPPNDDEDEAPPPPKRGSNGSAPQRRQLREADPEDDTPAPRRAAAPPQREERGASASRTATSMRERFGRR